jgi:branched-chain amino acid transport system permease protein
LNLGYAAFFAIGAYTYAVLNVFFGVPFWAGLLIAPLSCMAAGLILGFPAIRLRGDYLAIVTLGFGEIIRIVFNNLDVTGGPNGILGIAHPVLWIPNSMGGFFYNFGVNPLPYYYLLVLLILLFVFGLHRLEHSRIGRAFRSVREDETAAASSGVPVLNIKLLVHSLGASLAGFAGCVYAAKQGTVTPDSFDFILSVMILAMVVLGGLGNFWGAILGALVLGFLPEILRDFAAYRMLLFGIALVVIMLFRPGGILGGRITRKSVLHHFEAGEDPPSQEGAPAS